MKSKYPNLSIQTGTKVNNKDIYIEIQQDGPYVLHGKAVLTLQYIVPNQEGTSIAYQEGKTFKVAEATTLCRCSLSKHKPYCDGSHHTAAQKGVNLRETATFAPSLKTAEIIEGPVVSLTDDEKLCAFARFCDNGKRIWNQVEGGTPQDVELSVTMAHLCPSGRLIVWDDRDNTPIESQQEPQIGLIEDIANRFSGPIFLNGGIPVQSANGQFYEVRNRQTLCRCGQSSNKPFCDGTHASMKFQDELMDETL
ncbi:MULTISPECIES: CDGSH iron-sulfur domain-containing protein [Chitinophagaceae]